jgi:hypothetical protein
MMSDLRYAAARGKLKARSTRVTGIDVDRYKIQYWHMEYGIRLILLDFWQVPGKEFNNVVMYPCAHVTT